MKKILYTNPKLLIADEGKRIKILTPAVERDENGEETGNMVYDYSTIIFLANNVKEEQIDELYEEVEGE